MNDQHLPPGGMEARPDDIADRLLNNSRAQSVDRLAAAIADPKRVRGALVKLYLENFKTLNDTFGREYGDALLREIVAFLAEETGGVIIRTIGVEFLVVLKGAGYTQAVSTGERVAARFDRAWHINGVDCLCTVYQAVLFYPDAASQPDAMLTLLDQTLSEALRQGSAEALVYDGALAERLARRKRIALSLKEAVGEGGCELRYRPTFCVEAGRFVRAECYLRIFVPGIGPVGEAEFLPIAEESGQICAVHRWAIERICALIARLTEAGCDFESVAVPVSATLLLQEGFPGEVAALMKRFGIGPGKLGLEVAESALLTSSLAAGMAMQELSDLGVEMVLADFGTGYSGINSTLSLPVDVLKLERLFVWQLETNPTSGVLIEGLISIARKLGLKLIAEGVETDNQVERLDRFGCRYRQGFYYSATVEEDELFNLLKPAAPANH